MLLQIARDPDAGNGEDAALCASVAKKLPSQVRLAAKVEIAEPGTLPRSFGKSRRVTDKRL
jgi:phenylacetate-CoA ligase